MENIYIVRCGESALKGKNKPYFERMLVQRIKKVLKDIEGITAERVDGLIFVRTPLVIIISPFTTMTRAKNIGYITY